MARKNKKPKREIIKIQIDMTRDGFVMLPPALGALPRGNTESEKLGIDMAIRIIECHGRGETKTIAPKSKFARELGEKRIDVELAAAAEQYAQSISGGPVSLGGLYVALQRVGHRLQQPFLLEGISRLLEFCLRQTGTRFMDRFGLVLSVKRQLENMPLEVHKKSPLLQILSEDQRKILLSKKLKLPLSEDSPLWGIVSKIAYWLKHPCAAEPATMFDGYKTGKKEWDRLSRGESG